jgi:hypothetical protein
MLRVQAVFAGVPIIQAGNMAPSAVFRANGQTERLTTPIYEANNTRVFILSL